MAAARLDIPAIVVSGGLGGLLR
nr:hypothetical protein [Caloramator sp. E03]